MSERVVETILELTADPLRVWNAITDPEQLSRWFPDEVEFDPRPGAPGAFTWKDHGRFAVEGLSPALVLAIGVDVGIIPYDACAIALPLPVFNAIGAAVSATTVKQNRPVFHSYR